MTPERRQQAILALLLVVLVVVGGRSILRSTGESGDGLASPGNEQGADLGSVLQQVERLRLSDLELGAEEFDLGRDPFRFVSPPQPRPAPPQNTNQQRNRARKPKPPPANTNAAQARPQPPSVDVVYLGRFGAASRPIAVFSDGKEIFNAFQGGVLKGKFAVDKIGYESADLKFVGFPDAPAKRLAVGG